MMESVDKLRLAADIISERGVSSGDLAIIEIRLREAADTIESMQDRLQDADDARYDAGFKNGIKACLQQLDGLIHEGADVDEIQAWVDRQWEEEV